MRTNALLPVLLQLVLQSLLVVSICEASKAAPLPLIPRSELLLSPLHSCPQISPAGDKLAYLAPSQNGYRGPTVSSIWVRTIGTQDDRVVISQSPGSIEAFQWRADGNQILYAWAPRPNGACHLYEKDLETHVIRDLTPINGCRVNQFYMSAQVPDQALVMLSMCNDGVYAIYKADLNDGALDLVESNPENVFPDFNRGWAVDKDLVPRAKVEVLNDGSTQLMARDGAGKPWRLLHKTGRDDLPLCVYGLSADNRSMLYGSSAGSNTLRLYQYNFESGQSQLLASEDDVDLLGIISSFDGALQAAIFERDLPEFHVLDRSLDDDFARLKILLKGSISINSEDRANHKWVVAQCVDNAPTSFYLYDREKKSVDFLMTSQSGLESYKFAPMRPITILARDGLSLHGYLTLPEGVPPQNLPFVLLVHGGPGARDCWQFDPVAQWLANRGYGVLKVNFRGSTGYGKNFCHLGDRQWGLSMNEDLVDAKRWAVKEGYADPKKVAIMGASYGGYATLAALAFTPDEFACGIDACGPSDLPSYIQTLSRNWLAARPLVYEQIGNPIKDAVALRVQSPRFSADKICKPLLIAHGTMNQTVILLQSNMMSAALEQAHKFVYSLTLPGLGHTYWDNTFFSAAERFLASQLGGRCEPQMTHAGEAHVRTSMMKLPE